MMSGAALLGISGLQTLGSLLADRRRQFKRRRRYALRRDQFDGQFTGTLKWARAAKPIFKAWARERPFRVAAIIDEALGYRSYYLVPADGQALPRFEPGQYLTFSLPVDPQRKPIVRCYSLSERPREDYYRITVKLAEPPTRGVPAGQGSGYFHTLVKVGSTVGVQAPQGAFFLDPSDQLPIVLISGGVGITPVLSMLSSIVHERSSRSVYLFAGFRNSSEHPCRDQLAELAKHDNIHCDISYSRPLATDRLGSDYTHLGHAAIARLRQVLPSSNFRFYVCGPPNMMEKLVPALWEWGVPESHVHFEAFGPASVKSLRKENLGEAPCQVGFAKSRSELTWKGEYPSLLDLGESEGIVLDYGCRAGSCGQCALKVRQGTVTHTKTPGVSLANDECLACIGVPTGDVVLEA
jgi:ferredoxin-NADP reductase